MTLQQKKQTDQDYQIVWKDPIAVLKSIMANDPTFITEYPKRTNNHGDIRNGSVFRAAASEVRAKNKDGVLIGFMLAIDDTPLTQHSGTHNARPVYITTCNQSLASRRKRITHSWRVLAFLPVLNLGDTEKLNTEEKKWAVHAKIEFQQRVLKIILKPLAGTRLQSISAHETDHCQI